MPQLIAKQANWSRPALAGLWSLLWRAVLLTPFAIIFGVVWVVARPLLFLLPICGVYYLWERDWFFASIVATVWVLLFCLTRSKWFKMDRRDFPNEQENV
jgi:hypothetical protein